MLNKTFKYNVLTPLSVLYLLHSKVDLRLSAIYKIIKL